MGWLYAHASTKWLSPKVALILHGGLFLSAFLFLPIAIAPGFGHPPASGQSIWLLGLFALSIGLPFLAVSANAPLLQAWFSRTSHPHASDPYFLYGSSNIGSFSALILYIIVFEPLFTLSSQSQLWAFGYALLMVMVVACGLLALRSIHRVQMGNHNTTHPDTHQPVASSHEAIGSHAPSPKIQDIAWWIILAALPSGLLVAVTAHISTDVAAAPFLWVIPLALFLLTFVLAFRTRPLISIAFLSKWISLIVAINLIGIFISAKMPIWASISLNLTTFFASALFCHLLLVARRPAATHLTAFYLWMSFGGFIGGCLTSLLAPHLFNVILEYPLLLLAILLVRPNNFQISQHDFKALPLIAIIFITAYFAMIQFDLVPPPENIPFDILLFIAFIIIGITIAMVIQKLWSIPAISFSILFIFCSIILFAYQYIQKDAEFIERSFFGMVKVKTNEKNTLRIISHGTTVHGATLIDHAGEAIRPLPLTYYHPLGTIAASLKAAQKHHGGAIKRGGIVGLGAGSLMCLTKENEKWTLFEIDQLVIKIALDSSLFRFIEACAPNADIILGDARLSLADIHHYKFDYLLIDAFSSDAIPVHLLTQEAIRLYFSKITEDGVLAVHISNRHMDLSGVLAAIAKAQNLVIRQAIFKRPDTIEEGLFFCQAMCLFLRVAKRIWEQLQWPHAGIFPKFTMLRHGVMIIRIFSALSYGRCDLKTEWRKISNSNEISSSLFEYHFYYCFYY